MPDAGGPDGLLRAVFVAIDPFLADGATIYDYVAHPAGARSFTFSNRFISQG